MARLRAVLPLFALVLYAACSGGRGDVRGTTGSTGSTVTNTKPPETSEKQLPERDGMVHVPGGWSRLSIGDDGKKYRKVYVTGFWIDKTEVSNRDFGAFIKAGGYTNPKYWTKEGWAWREAEKITMPRWWAEQRYQVGPNYPEYPVSGISWYEADAYARWKGKRLPTEAEWERASRGDGKTFFPWGNAPIDYEGKVFANFAAYTDGFLYSAPILAFPQGKSPWGCYNMLGNVWEWVQDFWTGEAGYTGLPERDPVNLKGDQKLLRGGSWFRHASFFVQYYRLAAEPGSRKYDDVGFRCARDHR